MRRYIFILVLLFIAGCGGGPYVYDEEFQPYIDSFQDDARLHGKTVNITNVSITYDENIPYGKLGVCKGTHITINPGHWGGLPKSSRKQLLYHELGHCALFRKHDDSRTEDGRPASIMNRFIIDRYMYEANEKEYIDELFKD